jgi:putative transposase
MRIVPSTYYERLARTPGCRDQRDSVIAALIAAQRDGSRFAGSLGSRKMWLRLCGQGHEVARCTVERVIRAHGWDGARRGHVRPAAAMLVRRSRSGADTYASLSRFTITPTTISTNDRNYAPSDG